jgi:uronate dehydrogenase
LAEQIWVLTGSSGSVGRCLTAGLAPLVGTLRLVDIVPPPQVPEGCTFTHADIRDHGAVAAALACADGVVHLAGIPDEAHFADLVESNIIGTHHVFEACRVLGIPRVVYASSNRATGFNPVTTMVDPEMPGRPDGLYGASKLAVEAVGRVYADKFGLQVVNVRIGSYLEAPTNERHLATWLSPRDCVAAFVAAMTAPGVDYATFYGVSANTRRFWSLDAGIALGFVPQDDAEQYADRVEPWPGRTDVQGGGFASQAYTLDRQRPLS